MFDLTQYSFLWVTAAASICMLIYIFVTESSADRIPMWATVLFAAVVCARMLVPVEILSISYTLISFVWLPPVHEILNSGILGTNITVFTLLITVWAAGTVCFLTEYAYAYFRLQRIIRQTPQIEDRSCALLDEIKREQGIKFGTKIIRSHTVEYPAECGFFRQTIFLNGYEYNEDELRYILLHELTHFRYKTNWINLFADIMQMMFWWNPVIYIFKQYIYNQVEIYVDSRLTKGMNDILKCGYMKCMLKVSEIIGGADRKVLMPVMPFIGQDPDKLMLKRFGIIKNRRKTGIDTYWMIGAVICLFMYTSCRFVLQPGWYPPSDEMRNMASDEFTEANSYIVERDGGYVLYYNGEPFLYNDDLSVMPDVTLKQ